MRKYLAVLIIVINNITLGQANQFLRTSWDEYKSKNPDYVEPMLFKVNNHFPKINEVVNIEVKYTSPFNWSKNELNLCFEIPGECELVKGNNLITKEVKKGEVIDLEVSVRFNTKSVFRLGIRDSKWSDEGVGANLYFYVEGAFHLASEVANLESDVIGLENTLENMSKGTLLPAILPYRDYLESNESMTEKIVIIPNNDYEKSIIEELKSRNIQELKNLRAKYDSLKTDVNKKMEELNNKSLKRNNGGKRVKFEWKRN